MDYLPSPWLIPLAIILPLIIVALGILALEAFNKWRKR